MRTALTTVLAAGALVGVAFGADATTAPLDGGAEANPAPTELVVTNSDPAEPVSCRPRRIGKALIRWNRALNAGDTKTLRRFWKEEQKGLRNDRRSRARGTFKWFSISGSPSPTHKDFTAFQPRRALKYVRKRGGFRLQLTDVIGTGGFRGLWLLDDGSVRRVGVKGATLCRHRKRPLIKLWSMRVLDPGEESLLNEGECPDPPGGASPGVLVACSGPED